MATLERAAPTPSEQEEQQEQRFEDAERVPTGFSDYAALRAQLQGLSLTGAGAGVQQQGEQQEEEEDLIDLGQERLFSGTRTVKGTLPSEQQLQLQLPEGTPVVSNEILSSLEGAKHAFFFALHDLLLQLQDDHYGILPSSSSHPLPAAHTTQQQQQQQQQQVPESVDEILLSVDRAVPLLTPLDADLARALGGLLAAIERLGTICRPTTTGTTGSGSGSVGGSLRNSPNLQRRQQSASGEGSPASLAAAAAPTGGNVYETLEREARSLRTSKASWGPSSSSSSPKLQQQQVGQEDGGGEDVLSAVKAVAKAERELLWGRVDDLSERVSELCRERAELIKRSVVVEEQQPGGGGRGGMMMTESKSEEESLSDLPRYHEAGARLNGGAAAGNMAMSPGLPPAYFVDYAKEEEMSEKDGYDKKEEVDEKAAIRPPAGPLLSSSAAATSTTTAAAVLGQGRRLSGAQAEKMRADLDSVSAAIERLYLVSPQLANQRVEPDRRKTRERQLAKLGNAIERLSKGRLEDQRAKASPVLGSVGVGGGQGVTLVTSTLEARRREATRLKEESLDKLLSQIDKAASRTLVDQRVEISGKRRQQHHQEPRVIVSRLDINRFPALRQQQDPQQQQQPDGAEVDRRAFILEHTGRGRLESQDASFAASSSTVLLTSPKRLSQHAGLDRVRRDEEEEKPEMMMKRRNSLPGGFLLGGSGNIGVATKRTPPTSSSSPRGGVGAGEEKEMATTVEAPPMLARRSSVWLTDAFRKLSAPGSSRRGSVDTRLGLGLVGSGMSRAASAEGGAATSGSSRSSEAWGFLVEEQRNLGALNVMFWGGGEEGWELSRVESKAVILTGSSGKVAKRIPLPTAVIPNQQASIVSASTFLDLRLLTNELSPTTHSRPDLEVDFPLSAKELSAANPTHFDCANCGSELVNYGAIKKYASLPSEHWTELLEAWMCHQPETMNEEIITRGRGIKPGEGQAMVGSTYVLLRAEVTKGWKVVAALESSRNDIGDLLEPICCVACDHLIGSKVTPPRPLDGTPVGPTCVRLIKYAVRPAKHIPLALALSDKPNGEVKMPRYSLSCHLMAELLEIGQVHACHRFVVEDLESGTARLLMWLFNPAIRLSFPVAGDDADLLPVTPTTPTTPLSGAEEPGSRTMNAVKVFYVAIDNVEDPKCQAFLKSDTFTTEVVTYPREVTDSLTRQLRLSTLLYPVEKRTWAGEMDVGFLERT